MTIRTVPFDHGLFYNAMLGLFGREPDEKQARGLSGEYIYRYVPWNPVEGASGAF